MKTTASLLTLAISLALGATALANETPERGADQDTTSQQLTQQQGHPSTTDPVDTMDDPLDPVDPVAADPLTAETVDSSTMDQADPDDMDEPAYESTVSAELPPGSDAGTGQAPGVAGGPPSGALQEFASYDSNGDGFVERSELKGDNALLNDGFVRFDSNNDRRLDRYEFDSISTGSFAKLDTNGDSFLDETEASAFASLGTSFASVDIDGDGRISETEHRAFLDSDAWASDSERYSFVYLDLDGDGFVSRTEAAQFADFHAEFDVLDEDADGLVDSSQYDLFMNDWDADGMAYETEEE